MGYTRGWRDVSAIVSPLLKGVGNWSAIAIPSCDATSADMYIEYPWKDTITTIAPSMLPLVDGQQDYSSPINIYRLTKATIVRLDITPNDYYDLDVVDDQGVDLVKRAYRTLRCVSQQQAFGTLRLEAAPNIASGMQLELRGEYQLNPTKIVDLNQDMWFKDQYWQVAVEGVLYWGYKLSDDPRAGTAFSNGKQGYSGQLGIYKAALNRMRNAEDWGASQNLFPAEPMGVGRDYNGLNIYGW